MIVLLILFVIFCFLNMNNYPMLFHDDSTEIEQK